MPKTIFTGYAPNLTWQDTKTALNLLSPLHWNTWNRSDAVEACERWLEAYFNTARVSTVDSGRTALRLSLQAVGVKAGDGVLVQAFTCLVVINAITTLGAHPVYVDIDRSYNMDPTDLEKKYTANCRAMIIQHTFGTSAQLEPLLRFATTHALPVIEDCAHALGGEYNGKKLGTFGDLAILSFGSDKMISCVRGGAIVVHNSTYSESVSGLVSTLPKPPHRRTFQHLMHLPMFAVSKPMYHLGIGKGILKLAALLHITNRIIYPEEKLGLPMHMYPSTLANPLATILLTQLHQLNNIITQRKTLAKQYAAAIKNKAIKMPLQDISETICAGSSMLRFPILVEKPYALYLHAKQQGILLGNWYDAVVSPMPQQQSLIQYTSGSCPVAERVAKQTVNLPTDRCIGVGEFERIISCLNSYRA